MASTVLKSWLTALEPNLVVGRIRWSRALGRPEGNASHAFFILCYHFDEEDRNPGGGSPNLEHPRSLHSVTSWEGPHDGDHFQVSFLTDARTPRGYKVDSQDSRKDENYVDVTLLSGVVWIDPKPGVARQREVRPQHLVFEPRDPPTGVQRLPDIEVVRVTI